MPLSDAVKTSLIDYIFRGQALTVLTAPTTPANLYFALFDTNGDELDYTGYARVAVSRGSGSFDAPSGTGTVVTANTGAITFPAASAGGPQEATDMKIMTASSGGTVVATAELPTPQTITDGGSAPVFAVGAFDVSWPV